MGGPVPDEQFVEGYLAVSPAEMPLARGDRAALLLTRLANGRWATLPVVGTYRLDAGAVGVIADNPFADVVRAMTEADLIAALRSP